MYSPGAAPSHPHSSAGREPTVASISLRACAAIWMIIMWDLGSRRRYCCVAAQFDVIDLIRLEVLLPIFHKYLRAQEQVEDLWVDMAVIPHVRHDRNRFRQGLGLLVGTIG